MGKVCISIAHSKVSPGAINRKFGLDEYSMSERQSKFVFGMLHEAGHEVFLFDTPKMMPGEYKSAKVQRANEDTYDLCIEIHHNASESPSINYGMVIYSSANDKAREAAKVVSESLEQFVPWRWAGARNTHGSGFDLKRLWWAREVRSPSIIIEAGFITADQAGLYLDDDFIDGEAEAIAAGIDKWLRMNDG